ncbi:hypothetical protein S40288_04048 [Stachybotrys chartarum IBT 40288]|nr:hypothetical protein S40288_04048 [Stachybotrys chartarum IBT 40288]
MVASTPAKATSLLSSPDSFYTAKDSSEEPSTDTSSLGNPLSSPYRHVRQLPHELKEHCQIFLEEQLCKPVAVRQLPIPEVSNSFPDVCAVSLLNSILGAGGSRKPPTSKAVMVPPASHLALLNTIVIHPTYTSRAETLEHLDTSTQALAYLRNLLAMVGPLNADFRTAFQFHSIHRWTRFPGDGGHRDNDSDMSEGGEDYDGDHLRGKMANEGSLWSRGQDFWSTVGWAFNCSTLHPHRWRYWKTWLEFMMDVIEADWAERGRRDVEAHEANGGVGAVPVSHRSQSLMFTYMDQQTGRHHGSKAIMKAILAAGDSVSTSFTEIFDKEHKGPRKQPKKRKRGQLDLQNDQYGDYFDDESMSSGVSEPPTPEKPREQRNKFPFGTTHSGLVDSTALRLRLFKMLSEVTHVLRSPADLDKLYEDFATAVKLLPLQTFSVIVSQRPSPLLMETHVSLTRELFRLLLPSSYKDPRKVDREAHLEGSITESILEQCYIPHPANTVALEDNAKLSLVVENAIHVMWKCDALRMTKSFVDAAEKGIRLREEKATRKRTGKLRAQKNDTTAQDILNNSSRRIQLLLEVIEAAEGMAE